MAISDIFNKMDMSQKIFLNEIYGKFNDSISDVVFRPPVVFEHTMPDLATVEAMARDYPAFKKSFEQFKLMYHTLHDEWATGQQNQVK